MIQYTLSQTYKGVDNMALIYEIIDTQRLRQKAPSNWKRIVNISFQLKECL